MVPSPSSWWEWHLGFISFTRQDAPPFTPFLTLSFTDILFTVNVCQKYYYAHCVKIHFYCLPPLYYIKHGRQQYMMNCVTGVECAAAVCNITLVLLLKLLCLYVKA